MPGIKNPYRRTARFYVGQLFWWLNAVYPAS